MGILDKARELGRQGRNAEALACVEEAAREGDAEALLAVGYWRLFGLHRPRDLAAAHDLLERAGAAGSSEAVRVRATLIGNGTGCPSDPEQARRMYESIADRDRAAALQLALLAKMRPAEEAAATAPDTLSEDPPVRLLRGLLGKEECDYLIAQAEPELQPSYIDHPETGQRVLNPVRSSLGMSFGPAQEDLVVHRINLRLAVVTGTRAEWGEQLHMLRYTPGQEYRPHLDAIPGAANQRAWTVLVYLNEGYGGGETRFDRIGLSVRGRAGDALVYRNVDTEGRPDPRTRHAGLPVTSGAKWLATRWIRQAPYDPWDEQG
jgi:prolyl 4-hydroxylase